MQNIENPTGELLSEVYRNLKMASENLCSVTPKIDDRFMLRGVTSQLEKYAEYSKQAASMMRENAVNPKEPSGISKLMARSGIMMNTLVDSSDSHIAEMIVRGTKMGADKLSETMEKCSGAGCDQRSLDFCRDVINYEINESNKMKDFT